MSIIDPNCLSPPAEQQEEEVRTLLLRLLRLVAAEVAAQLQERDQKAPYCNSDLGGRPRRKGPEPAQDESV